MTTNLAREAFSAGDVFTHPAKSCEIDEKQRTILAATKLPRCCAFNIDVPARALNDFPSATVEGRVQLAQMRSDIYNHEV